MALGILLTLTVLYLIGIANELAKRNRLVEENRFDPIDNIRDYNIYDEGDSDPQPTVKEEPELDIYEATTLYDDLEIETFRLQKQIKGNKAIQNVRHKYEQSGIELPIELYAQCNQFTTEKEMINYLETMRKNMAKNLNMKLVKEMKSAHASKK